MKSALRIGLLAAIALTIGTKGLNGAALPLGKGPLARSAAISNSLPSSINRAVASFLPPVLSPSHHALSFQGDDPDFVDAISREFTLYNDPTGGSYESIDAISREFTLYNDPTGGSYESIDAISREFTLYNDPTGGVYESIDAISREFTITPFPGDVNRDGCVNDEDLIAVLFAFGQTGSDLPEDLNRDGRVDDGDLVVVLFNFGMGCGHVLQSLDAISREFTMYNDPTAGIYESIDAISREFTMYNDPLGIPLPGDVNRDGCVNDEDLIAILFAFGRTGSDLPEDLNRDGRVDDGDLVVVLFNFGLGCGLFLPAVDAISREFTILNDF